MTATTTETARIALSVDEARTLLRIARRSRILDRDEAAVVDALGAAVTAATGRAP